MMDSAMMVTAVVKASHPMPMITEAAIKTMDRSDMTNPPSRMIEGVRPLPPTPVYFGATATSALAIPYH
jgi:hypothetical protein